MSSVTVAECHGCGRKTDLVELTAEDIGRTHPPSISKVCETCRGKLRAAARLETSYSTGLMVQELSLMVLAGFSLLVLSINILAALHVSFLIGTFGINLLVPAVVSVTGLRMTYSTVGDRYGLTHDLAWSLHSRRAVLGVALILSGIFSTTFYALLS